LGKLRLQKAGSCGSWGMFGREEERAGFPDGRGIK
jgi:hypothetical protein